MRSSLFCYHEWAASQGPDWGEKRPLPQASAQGGRPGKDKGACIHAIICLLRSQAPFEYFLSKGKEQRRVAAHCEEPAQTFPFFPLPGSFNESGQILCRHSGDSLPSPEYGSPASGQRLHRPCPVAQGQQQECREACNTEWLQALLLPARP